MVQKEILAKNLKRSEISITGKAMPTKLGAHAYSTCINYLLKINCKIIMR